MRKQLEEAASDLAGPLKDQLRDQLGDIIRKAQTQVYHSYRSNDPSRELSRATTVNTTNTTSSLHSALEATSRSPTAAFESLAATSAVHEFPGDEAVYARFGVMDYAGPRDPLGRGLADMSRMEMGLAQGPEVIYEDGGDLNVHGTGGNVMEDASVVYEGGVAHAEQVHDPSFQLVLESAELNSWYDDGRFQFPRA